MIATTVRTASLAAALWALAACGPEESSVEVVVDTFNVGLAGAFVPNEAARRAPVVEAVAALDSDVVCLQEVWLQSDKDRIAEAAAARFPYSLSFVDDLDTELTDGRDQSGETPTAPTAPPCAAASLSTSLEAALACLRDNCSTEPGSETGRTTSTDCAQDSCIGQVSSLLLGDAAALRCYGCLTTSLPTETFADIRQLCTEEVNAGLAFRGQSGVVILSRHPLADGRETVVPGTWNRRIVASARVELPNDASVEVHCTHLTPIFDSIAFPYTGEYGEGQVTREGWAAEQRLQARRLVELVEAGRGGPTLVLGDLNAGRAGPGLVAEGPETLDVLEELLVPAVVEGYEPLCTFCPDNPNNGPETDPVWIDHIYMAGLPGGAVSATERTFTEPSVPVDGDPDRVPLSDHYGLRSTLSISP